MKKIVIIIGICSLLMFFASICLFTCNGKSDEQIHSDTTINKTIVSGGGGVDSIPVPYRVEYPVWLLDTIRDSVFIKGELPLDTLAIIADYFTNRSYSIPYEDSIAKITADITICENKVQQASFAYEFTQTNTTITNTKIITSKWNMAAGVSASYSIPDKNISLQITAGLDYKKSRFLIGYDFLNNSVGAGYQYKFFNSKK